MRAILQTAERTKWDMQLSLARKWTGKIRGVELMRSTGSRINGVTLYLFVLCGMGVPAAALADFSPPEEIWGLMASGRPGIGTPEQLSKKAEDASEESKITVQTVRTAMRVYPLYTRTMSQVTVFNSGEEITVALSIPLFDMHDGFEKELARASGEVNGNAFGFSNCSECGKYNLQRMLKREKKRFIHVFPEMAEFEEDFYLPTTNPLESICCLRTVTVSLTKGVNTLLTDVITYNNAHYMRHNVGGSEGFATANFLTPLTCEKNETETTEQTLILRVFNHNNENNTVEVLPKPTAHEGNRFEWHFSAPCHTDDIQVFLPFVLSGSLNHIAYGIMALTGGIHEEYKDSIVPQTGIASIEASSHKKKHLPDHVYDDDPAHTYWESKPEKGQTQADFLNIQLVGQTPIAAIGIVPGNWSRWADYINSNRPRHVIVSAKGQKIWEADLADKKWAPFVAPVHMDVLEFDKPFTTDNLKLEITDIYPGKKNKTGVAISELVLFKRPVPTPLEMDFPATPKQATKQNPSTQTPTKTPLTSDTQQRPTATTVGTSKPTDKDRADNANKGCSIGSTASSKSGVSLVTVILEILFSVK